MPSFRLPRSIWDNSHQAPCRCSARQAFQGNPASSTMSKSNPPEHPKPPLHEPAFYAYLAVLSRTWPVDKELNLNYHNSDIYSTYFFWKWRFNLSFLTATQYFFAGALQSRHAGRPRPADCLHTLQVSMEAGFADSRAEVPNHDLSEPGVKFNPSAY